MRGHKVTQQYVEAVDVWPEAERCLRWNDPEAGEGAVQTTPTVFSFAFGWISFWLITTVWPRKRSMMERT
jgi:hypothetical protein